jgi:hypothetical protein
MGRIQQHRKRIVAIKITHWRIDQSSIALFRKEFKDSSISGR